jgi:hypothetical protein
MPDLINVRHQPEPQLYTREQLDELCEQIILQFCMDRYGQELNPVPTQVLLQLLEETRSRCRSAGGTAARYTGSHAVLLGPQAGCEDSGRIDAPALA